MWVKTFQSDGAEQEIINSGNNPVLRGGVGKRDEGVCIKHCSGAKSEAKLDHYSISKLKNRWRRQQFGNGHPRPFCSLTTLRRRGKRKCREEPSRHQSWHKSLKATVPFPMRFHTADLNKETKGK